MLAHRFEMPDVNHRREVGKMAYLAESRGKWAALFHHAPLRWSVTAGLVWKLRAQSREVSADELEFRLGQGALRRRSA